MSKVTQLETAVDTDSSDLLRRVEEVTALTKLVEYKSEPVEANCDNAACHAGRLWLRQ